MQDHDIVCPIRQSVSLHPVAWELGNSLSFDHSVSKRLPPRVISLTTRMIWDPTDALSREFLRQDESALPHCLDFDSDPSRWRRMLAP